MKVQLTNTFFKSLKKLSRSFTWYMKLIDLFRYNIPHYLKNLKRFNKTLWYYRGWNGDNSLLFMEQSLKHTAHILKTYGSEEEISRNKKISKIERACEILNNINEDSYIELAEKQLGIFLDAEFSFCEPDEDGNCELIMYKNEEDAKKSSKVFELTRKIEEDEWNELWYLLKGQDLKDSKDYENDFDGSGIRGWWD